MTANAFDAALVQRYDRPGPRYTSYPTAVQFSETFGPAEYRLAAAESARRGGPLSVYVHVPFCASPCFYCACTRLITRQRSVADVYLARLMQEIELQSALFDSGRELRQLHLGGGTPTYLDLEQLARLVGGLARHFRFSDGARREYSIEIDPRTADADTIAGLAGLGFNRLSAGVQDFDPDVQAAINRVQSFEETAAVVESARRHGFRSVSLDLIYGLPLQTEARFAQTLERVLQLAPDRIAAYSYAHLPRLFRAQRQIRARELPDASTKLRLLQLTVERLTAAGYVYIGMDHFARPDDELARALAEGTLQRNFQGYSTHADCDLVGLGLSAIGRLADSYSQNAKTLDSYYRMLDAGLLPVQRGLQLGAEDRLRRAVIQALMCQARVDTAALGRAHGVDFERHFAAELAALEPMAADGLVEIERGALVVTPRGRFLLRALAMVFDAYLKKPEQTAPEPPRFSRVI